MADGVQKVDLGQLVMQLIQSSSTPTGNVQSESANVSASSFPEKSDQSKGHIVDVRG